MLFSNGAIAGSAPVPDEALTRLADVSRSVLQAPGALEADAAAGLASAVAEGVRRPQGWPDDVAVLVAHRRETALEPLQLDLVAVPAALPGVRRRLGAWLDGLGMGEQDRVGVMVAVGEACANAAEHAYRGSEPGPMSVDAHVDVDGVLTVVVRDEGSWRPPDRDPGDRGRGLLIMRQLVDTVVLDERDQGTTVTLSVRLRRTPDVDVDQPVNAAGASVHVDRDGPRPVVSVAGAVDEISAEQMRIRLLEASHGGTGRVELDLVARHVVQQRRGPGGARDRAHRPRRGLAAGRARARGRRHPAHPRDQRPERARRAPLTPGGGCHPAVRFGERVRCTSSGRETSAQRRERTRVRTSQGRAGVRLLRHRRRR